MVRSPRPAVGLASLALAGLLVLAVPPTGPAHAETGSGSIGIRLLDAPVERADDPRAHSNIVDHLAPGDVIERRVEVVNDTDGAVTLPVYVGGAEVEGEVFRPFDERDRGDLAQWGDVAPAEVTLGPGERARPTVRLAVPDDAPAGERYGVVWVEAPRADDGSIEAVNRVGVRIYLSVGEGDEPATDFRIDGLTAQRPDTERLHVHAEVTNTGGRALDLTGELSLSDGPGGLSLEPVSPVSGRVLGIGDRGRVTFALDPSLPAGTWHAEVMLRSGTVERDAEGELRIPEPGDTTQAEVDEGQAGDIPPWLLAVAWGLLLLVLVALVVVLARHRREEEDDEDDEGPPAAVAAPSPRAEAGVGARQPSGVEPRPTTGVWSWSEPSGQGPHTRQARTAWWAGRTRDGAAVTAR